jgi:hypothetical protein
MHRAWDNIIEPGPTTMTEVMLILLALGRGLGVLVFDGITTNVPAYRMALGLASATTWAWVLVALAVFQAVALVCGFKFYRFALLLVFFYWLLWTVLVAASAHSTTVIPLLVPWLGCCLASAWVYLVRAWGE